MKRIFRRNQIIITTLAVMIAAAGYLNYSSKKEVAGAEVYEAGMMDISDSDILAENQAKNGVDDGKLKEIASPDGDGEELLPMEMRWRRCLRVRNLLVQKFPGRRQRLRELRIRVRRCSPAEQGSPST